MANGANAKAGESGRRQRAEALGCAAVRSQLGRFAAGELGAAAERAIAAHLEGCAACAGERLALVEVEAALAGAFVDHPFDARLADRIIASAARAPAHAPRPAGWEVRAGGGAGASAAGASPTSRASVSLVRRRPSAFPRGASLLAAAALLAVVGLTIRSGLADRGGAATEAGPPVAVARVDAKGGRVAIERADGRGSGILFTGSRVEVRAGDRLLAEAGGAVLAFHDGTVVHVRPDTTIEVQGARPRESRRPGVAIVGGPGEVFCEVAEGLSGFAVESADATVEALGTRFGVRALGDRTYATVLDGEVRVTASGSGETAILRGGEQVIASRLGRRLERGAADLAADLGWAVSGLPARAAAAAGALPRPASPAPPAPRFPAPPGAHDPAAGASGSDLDLPIGIERER